MDNFPAAGDCTRLCRMFASSLALGPFRHETDQTWLLDDGKNIGKGHLKIARLARAATNQ